MIKVDKTKVTLEGSVMDITAEFSIIANALKRFAVEEMDFDDESAKKFVIGAAEAGLLSKDEMKEMAKEAKKEILKDLTRLFFGEDEEDE